MDRPFFQGEYRRVFDERYRVSIPGDWIDPLEDVEWVLAKERPGALSLWLGPLWQQQTRSGVEVIRSKFQSGRLDDRLDQLQHLGRLLSTRHQAVQLAGRGRLVIPEGFREFLGVEAGGAVMVVGAAVCIEIWDPAAWVEYLRSEIGDFPTRLENLAR